MLKVSEEQKRQKYLKFGHTVMCWGVSRNCVSWTSTKIHLRSDSLINVKKLKTKTSPIHRTPTWRIYNNMKMPLLTKLNMSRLSKEGNKILQTSVVFITQFNHFPTNDFLNKFVTSTFNIQESQSLIQAREILNVLLSLCRKAGDQLVITKPSEH